MKTILPTHNVPKSDYNRIPTLVIAMPDVTFAEMIAEWQFNCTFRPLAVLDFDSSIFHRVQSKMYPLVKTVIN